MTSRPRRRRRWLVIIGLVLVLLCGTAYGVLRAAFHGDALGDKLSTILNKKMRGRVSIQSVRWAAGDLKKVLTGGWVPIEMLDVKVWDDCALNSGASAVDEIRTGDPNEDCTLDDQPDPDPTSHKRPRKLLLRTPRITGEVDVHALMFGNHDFVFRNVWVHGGEALLEETREPYPLHAYDRVIVSIVTAFYPRMRAGFRAGIYADNPPPIFDLRDIHVQDLNLTVQMNPYTLRPLIAKPSGTRPNAAVAAFTKAANYEFDAPLVVAPGDGCSPLPTNIAGRIVIVDGGGCTPKAKAKNVLAAGGLGMVLTGSDTKISTPPTLDDDETITTVVTIPVIAIAKRDGDALRGEITAGNVTATLRDTIGFVTAARMEHVYLDAAPADADPATSCTPTSQYNCKNTSYLYLDPVDPLVSKLYVRLETTAPAGRLRLWDEGLRQNFLIPAEGQTWPPKAREAEYDVEVADIKLNRLAQLPTEWTRRDYVANTLELDIEAKTVPCPELPEDLHEGELPVDTKDPKNRATVHITGELYNYWDRPYDGSWNLKLDGKNMGPTIHTCIKHKISGDNLDGTISLSGPFVASPKITAAMKNVDFDLPLRSGIEPLKLTLAEVEGSIDLVNEQGSLDKTTALIRNGKEPGEVVLSATFGLKPYNARAHVEIVKPIEIGRFVPEIKQAGTFLSGRMTAVGDADYGFSLEDFDLALGRTQKERAIRAYKGRLFTNDDFDTVKIQQVFVEAGRSRATIDGEVDLDNEVIKKIVVDGTFPDLGMWLERFGLPAFVQSAGGGQIVITGPIAKPTVSVAAELGGVPCLDKVRIIDSQFDSGTEVLDVRQLTSAGLGGQLTGSARIKVPDKAKGRPAMIEKLHVDGKRIDAAKICGLKGKVKGIVDTVDLDLAGTIDPNRTAMDWLSLTKLAAKAEHLSILDDKYADIALCVNRKDDSACRPRAQYLDSDDLAQCEQGKRAGFCAVATATRDGGGIIDATIARLPGTKKGNVTSPPRLAGTVAVSDLPVGIIDQLFAKPPAVDPKTKKPLPAAEPKAGGLASMTLHLEGTPDAPQASGAIQLLRSWVAGSFLGDAQLAVSPGKLGTIPGIAFDGTALAGRVRISGTLGTQVPYPVELQISGRRLEADVLLDLQKTLKLPLPAQAWMTGTITVRHELAPQKPVEPEAWIELSELTGIVTHKGTDGRLVPLSVTAIDQDRANRPAVSLRVTPSSVDFACRDRKTSQRVECATKLAIGPQGGKPAGVIDFRGHVTPQHMSIEAIGKLDIASLGPLLETQFSCMSGSADVSASISGSYKQPAYEASLSLDHMQATPLGGDTILEAESGLIRIANGSLGFTNVKLRVRDPHRDSAAATTPDAGKAAPVAANTCAGKQHGTARDEAGELFVKGAIKLDGLTPIEWGVLIEGKLAGKMLVLLAKNAISQATGLATIQGAITLTGKGKRPDIAGTLVFDPPPVCRSKWDPRTRTATAQPDDPADCRKPGELPRPITVIPRYLQREIALQSGAIELETVVVNDQRSYKVTIQRELTMSIDGEGKVFAQAGGTAEMADGSALKQLALTLDAENLIYRPPHGQINLTLNAQRVYVSRRDPQSNLRISGGITVVDGFYRQDFEIADTIKSLSAPSVPVTPVWDASSLLGNAELDLDVSVGKFALKSNIASIEMTGKGLKLTETPRDPRIAGSINVERGSFKFPGMRARFSRTQGTINFGRDEKASEPELSITSEADYRDLTGQDHVITLLLEGKVSSLRWDLRTSTGYNKSQTVALLLLGRNPEQLRRSLGDQILGSNINNIDPTTNPTQGFADQIVKDLAGDWVSDLLENSLTQITGLDVLRIEVGFGSIGLHIEKKLAENVNAVVTYEQTIRGNTVNARSELKTPFKVTVQGGYLRKKFNDPAEQDISDTSLKAVIRLLP